MSRVFVTIFDQFREITRTVLVLTTTNTYVVCSSTYILLLHRFYIYYLIIFSLVFALPANVWAVNIFQCDDIYAADEVLRRKGYGGTTVLAISLFEKGKKPTKDDKKRRRRQTEDENTEENNDEKIDTIVLETEVLFGYKAKEDPPRARVDEVIVGGMEEAGFLDVGPARRT